MGNVVLNGVGGCGVIEWCGVVWRMKILGGSVGGVGEYYHVAQGMRLSRDFGMSDGVF